MNEVYEKVLRQHVVNIVNALKPRVRDEIPASGQFPRISAKITDNIPDSHIKIMSLDVFRWEDEETKVSLHAVIIDKEDGNQRIPLMRRSKEEIAAYLDEDGAVDELTESFKTLFEYARG